MRKIVWAAVGLVMLAEAAFGQSEKIAITWGYEPGTYVMTVKMDMDQVTTMSTGQVTNQKIQMMMVMELEAGAKDAQGAQVLTTTFKRASQSLTGGPISMAYDSANPQGGNPMFASLYRAMLDKPIQMKLNKDGKVTDLSGLDAIWDAMAAENPSMALMAKNMKEQMGDTYLSQMMDLGRRMAPSSPVAVGDSWESDQPLNLPMIGPIQVKQTCTLKRVKDSPQGPVAVIAFNSTMETKEPKSVDTGAPGETTIDKVQIVQTGTIEMAVNGGMVLSGLSDQKTTMRMTMGGAPQPPEANTPAQPMTMEMQQSGTVETTTRKGKYKPPATAPTTRPATTQPEP
jgi:hypothetical protein